MALSSSSGPYINSSVLSEFSRSGASCLGCDSSSVQKKEEKSEGHANGAERLLRWTCKSEGLGRAGVRVTLMQLKGSSVESRRQVLLFAVMLGTVQPKIPPRCQGMEQQYS